MQLVLAIIQDADASALMRALREHAFNVTKLASSGGFLREGNTTLMIGLSADRLADLKTVVRQTCHTRTRLVSSSMSLPEQYEGMTVDSNPIEVSVGGAVLFVLGVQEFLKI